MNEKYKYVKLSYLEDICGDNNDLKKELVHIFLKQIPCFIANMKKYLNEVKREALDREAHTAKSSVLIFMMEETGDTLKQIQLLAKNNDKKTIIPLIDEVEASLKGATGELTDYLKEIN